METPTRLTQSIFAFKDRKIGQFVDPFPARTTGEAERIAEHALGNPESMLAKFPEDYSLYQVAAYDPQSGMSVDIQGPVFCCEVVHLLRVPPQDDMFTAGADTANGGRPPGTPQAD